MRRLRRAAFGVLVLVVAFMAVEAGRLYTAHSTVQDAALRAARYASTGQFDDALEGIVGCVDGDERGVKSSYVTSGGTIYEIYDGGAESLFATWYSGENCSPSYRVHQGYIEDMLRLVSITNMAREALGEPPIEITSEDDLRDFLFSLWEHDADVIACSDRYTLYGFSFTWTDETDTRFVLIPDEDGNAPACVLNEIVRFEDEVNNPGLRWADAGGASDTVTVIVSAQHNYLLGGSVPVRAQRAVVVESFTSSGATQVVALPPTATDTMLSPTLTDTRQPSVTPTVMLDDPTQPMTPPSELEIAQTSTAITAFLHNLTLTPPLRTTSDPPTMTREASGDFSLTETALAVAAAGTSTPTPSDPIWLALQAVLTAIEDKYNTDLTQIQSYRWQQTEFDDGIDDCVTLDDPAEARPIYFGWTFIITDMDGTQYRGRISFDRLDIAICEDVAGAGQGNAATPTSEGMPVAGGSGDRTATPQVIEAETNLQVRSALDGVVIGDGTISLYAPDAIIGAQSARVELELNLDNLYLTPTPAGDVTAFPVTRITSTPRSRNALGTPIPTPTPRNIVQEVSGSLLYQRMGATLLCPPGSFVGCDDGERSWQDVRLVTTNTTHFTWLLRAEPGITGAQEMTVEMWYPVRAESGSTAFVTLNEIPFTLDVRPVQAAPVAAGVGGNLLFIGVLTLVSLGGIVFTSMRLAQGRTFHAKDTKPKVFISYRRRPSWVTARAVANALEARGADVFLDVDDINEGRFADVLEQAIAECDYFLPILAPTTLESKWVRREIKRAMEQDKVIIPLVTDDFSFYGANLPDGLEELSSHNAVKVLPEYFEEAMDRIATRFINVDEDNT